MKRRQRAPLARPKSSAPGPLALTSPRWRTLFAHFGNGDDEHPSVPTLLEQWHDVATTYGEEYAYEPLFQAYLHQNTLADVAYAVVPHLVSRLAELDADRRESVLDDLALVEEVRQMTPAQVAKQLRAVEKHAKSFGDSELADLMLSSARARLAPLPSDLAPAYLAAMSTVETLAGARWRARKRDDNVTKPRFWRRHVAYLRNAGWTDADIELAIRAMRGEIEGIPEHDDFDPNDAVRLLASIKGTHATPGWQKRTRVTRKDSELAIRAVKTLSYWRLISPAKILRRSR